MVDAQREEDVPEPVEVGTLEELVGEIERKRGAVVLNLPDERGTVHSRLDGSGRDGRAGRPGYFDPQLRVDYRPQLKLRLGMDVAPRLDDGFGQNVAAAFEAEVECARPAFCGGIGRADGAADFSDQIE